MALFENICARFFGDQFARRNLTPYQRAELALELEAVIQEQSQQGRRTDLYPNSDKSEPLDTGRQIAEAAGISRDTIARVKVIRDNADEETKARLRRGESSVNAIQH